MRTPFPEMVERGRVRGDHRWSSRAGDDFGAFYLRRDGFPKPFLAIASGGNQEVQWEHVSVSIPGVQRCPTWEEMCWVKDLFWEPEEVVIQLHPPKSDYVNIHRFCLHLWRPLAAEIPLPPSEAVGPKVAP